MLAALLAGLFAAAASAAEPAAPPLVDEAVRIARLCVTGGDDDDSVLRTAADPAPPGLNQTNAMRSMRVPTRAGDLRYYRDNGGKGSMCGFAVYGPEGPAAQKAVRRLLARGVGGMRKASAKYNPGFLRYGEGEYWGDRLAEGLRGVWLVSHPDQSGIPTFEFDYHQYSFH